MSQASGERRKRSSRRGEAESRPIRRVRLMMRVFNSLESTSHKEHQGLNNRPGLLSQGTCRGRGTSQASSQDVLLRPRERAESRSHIRTNLARAASLRCLSSFLSRERKRNGNRERVSFWDQADSVLWASRTRRTLFPNLSFGLEESALCGLEKELAEHLLFDQYFWSLGMEGPEGGVVDLTAAAAAAHAAEGEALGGYEEKGEEGETLVIFGLPFNPVPVAPPEFALLNDDESSEEDSSDGVEIVGQKGPNAMTDWPHPRETCTLKPFAPGDLDRCRERCAMCYCYVCDRQAGECPVWEVHCVATRTSSWWQQERDRVQRGGDPCAPRRRKSRAKSPASKRRNQSSTPPVVAGHDAQPCTAWNHLTQPQLRAISMAASVERRVRRGAMSVTVDPPACLAGLAIHDRVGPPGAHHVLQSRATLVLTPRARVDIWLDALTSRGVDARRWPCDVLLSRPCVVVVGQPDYELPTGVSTRFLRVVVDCFLDWSRLPDLSAQFLWLVVAPPLGVSRLHRVAKLLDHDTRSFRVAMAAFDANDPKPLALLLNTWLVSSPQDELVCFPDPPDAVSHPSLFTPLAYPGRRPPPVPRELGLSGVMARRTRAAVPNPALVRPAYQRRCARPGEDAPPPESSRGEVQLPPPATRPFFWPMVPGPPQHHQRTSSFCSGR